MGCDSCKKKTKVVKLDPPVVEKVWAPSEEDIKLAYAELTSILGVQEEKKEFINQIYKFLFNEDFDFNCRSCSNVQAMRFRNYMLRK